MSLSSPVTQIFCLDVQCCENTGDIIWEGDIFKMYFSLKFLSNIDVLKCEIFTFLKCQFQCFENFYNMMSKRVINFSKVSFITENYEEISFSNYNFYNTYFIYLSIKKKKYKYFWCREQSVLFFFLSFKISPFILFICLPVIIFRFYQINLYVLILNYLKLK